jgi:hypothetical protein
MANAIDREYIFPAVKIPFKSNRELQIKTIMDRTLKNPPKLPHVSLRPD